MTQPQHGTHALESLGRVHFIGIGGVGMSAVARIMVARGVPVSGSDAKVAARHGATSRPPGRGSPSAMPPATWATPRRWSPAPRSGPTTPSSPRPVPPGCPVLHRSEALAATMADDTVVAVAGTHGKSTTTSMITVLLQGAGLDPSFAIGANVPALGVNAAHGTAGIFVAEADESDGSFLNYRPHDRRGDQRRAGPPGLLRHRRGRLCLLRPLHGPAPGGRRPGGLR